MSIRIRTQFADWSLKLAADLAGIAFAPLLQKRCRTCLVAERLGGAGQCDACGIEPATEGDPPPSDSELREAILHAVGSPGSARRDHDALVLVSGGKDSLYMLARLRLEFPDLRLLALSVDNGFLNDLSLRNIAEACAAHGAESLILRPDAGIYRRIVAIGLRESGLFGCYRVDCMDGAIFRDLASKLASERAIPLILSGHTAAQTRTILGIEDFRLAPEALKADRVDYFGIPVDVIFPSETAHVWKGREVAPERIPAWIFPLHVWRPGQGEIESALRESGFKTAAVKQYLTGNALQALFLLHDLWNRGRFSYEPEVALLLRAGLVDRREWRRIFTLLELAGRSRWLIKRITAEPLGRLDLDFDQLFPRSRPVHESAGWRPRDVQDQLTRARH